MKCIAIYNNKGGVGKSTTTLFLADFFATLKVNGKRARVLVIDLDAQNSCSNALLGIEAVNKCQVQRMSISHLLLDFIQRGDITIGNYLQCREKSKTPGRKMPLFPLNVLLSNRQQTILFEKKCQVAEMRALYSFLKTSFKQLFDFVFVDLPANIDERNRLSHLGLLLSDFILIPIEPSRITINSLGDTFRNIHNLAQLQQKKQTSKEQISILLNKTDRRTRQYKLHFKELVQLASKQQTTILSNFLPHSSALCSASDDSIAFASLKDRYEANYNHVRKVSMELANKIGYKIATF